MCKSIIVPINGIDHECETVGELKAVLNPVMPYPGDELPPDNFCLCNVDEEATAYYNGLRAVVDGLDIRMLRVS